MDHLKVVLDQSLFRLFQRIPGKKRLLPITHALANQLQERFNIDLRDHQCLQISPNGVDLERYTDLPEPTAARETLGLPPALTVGYTGHLYPGRGMTLLTRACALLSGDQFFMGRWSRTRCK